MAVIVPYDRLWFQVLRAYRMTGGTGLSPTAVCALTGMPWPELKKEFEQVWALQAVNSPTRFTGTTHCGTVRAFLLIAYERPLGGVVGHIPYWPQLDVQTLKWPAPQYKSVSKNTGRMRLHTYNSQLVVPMLRDVVRAYKKEHGRGAY